ncbi:RNA ligase, partial [Thermococcus sp.]
MVSSGFRATLLKLGVPEDRLAVLEGKGGVVEGEFEGIRYVRFRDSAKGFRRGTVVFENGDVVLGFPHIKRVVQLDMGIKRVFKNRPFYVEEKVDGYNVRVVKVKDRVLALTRGGFICPFTTERILDFVNEEFFKDYPNLVLVGEMAGPESPYIVEGPP